MGFGKLEPIYNIKKNNMADKTNKIFTKVELDSTQAQIEIAKLNAKASDTTKSLEERISAKNKEVKIQEELSRKNIASLEKEIKSLRKMGASEKEVERATAKLNREKIKSTKVSERNTKQNNKLNASLGKSKKATRGLGGMFGALGQSVTRMIPALNSFKMALIGTGVGAFVVLIGSLIAMFSKAIKTGAKFGKAISTLKGISGATGKEIGILSQQARDLGASTAFTASEVVKLQTELAKLGFEAGEIQQATPSILDLAAALEVDLASAAALAGATINGFGLDASETKRVVDILAMSSTNSAQDFAKLTESFSNAAPAASAIGVSVEKTAAILGILADSAISGSRGGTALKNSFIELEKKGLTLEQALDKIGGSSNALTTAIDLVGKRGGPALLKLTERQDDIAKLTRELEGAGDSVEVAGEKFAGAAAALAAAKLDNLDGDITKLGSAWEGFILGIEDGTGPLNDLARGAVQLLTVTITTLGDAFFLMGFQIEESWENMKLRVSAGSDIVGARFKQLGGAIKIFANEALLSISSIPFIGEAIDKEKVKARINEAKDTLINASKQLADANVKLIQASTNEATFWQRLGEKKKQEAIAIEAGKARRARKKADDKALEESKKQREKDLKTIKDIEEDFRLKQQDLEDTTKIEKLERKRQRQLEEIEELKLSTAEKREAIKEVNAFYDEAERLAQEEADEKKRVKDEAQAEKDLEARNRKAEEDYNRVQAEIDQEQRLADEKRKIQDSYIGYIGQLGGILSSLAGKNKILATSALLLEKGSAIAGVVMKSIAAIAETKFNTTREVGQYSANAAATSLINPVASAVFGKMAIASAALGAKRIASTKVGAALSIASIGATTLSSLKGGGSAGGGQVSGEVPQGNVSLDTQTQSVNNLDANNASRVGTNSSISDNATASAVRNQTASGGQSSVAFYEGTYQEFRQGIEFRDGHSTIGG